MIIDIDCNLNVKLSLSIQKSRGCYGLIWFENGLPKPINRLTGTDENGILYIGKADNMLSRVGSLQKTILCNIDNDKNEPKIKGHQTLSKKFFRIRNRFKVEGLKIRIWNCPLDNPYEVESHLLEEYVKRFSELPPLNGQYGKFGLNQIQLKESVSLNLPPNKVD